MELKPCPFCGGAARVCNWGVWVVCCTECGASADWDCERRSAIENWNRRAEDGK